MRLLDRFRQWMVGRYGSDQLNIGLLCVYLLFSILSSVLGSVTLLLLSYAVIIFTFYRMFSRNITKRYEENQKFLHLIGPIRNKFIGRRGNQSNPYGGGYNTNYNPYGTKAGRKKPKTDKDHKVFQCGKCGQMIRVPKGKGKIAITCPRCKQEFVKRT